MTMTAAPPDQAKIDALRAARAAADQARDELNALIRETAADRGRLTIDAIAEAVGLSRQRIYQLLAGE